MPKKKSTASSRKKGTPACVNCDPNTHPMNRVTPLSKILAAVLFIVFPFIAFILGTHYQMMIDAAVCGVSAVGF